MKIWDKFAQIIQYLMKELILFTFGGAVYFLIEILARGYSHWTMFLLGGFCFAIIGLLNEKYTFQMSIITQSLISAVIITILEFITGCIVNIWLELNIWDYSDRNFNLLGQICLRNSCYWIFLGGAAIVIDDWIRYIFFDEEKPHYKII